MPMSKRLEQCVARFAADRVALRMFLADPDAWMSSNCAGFDGAEIKELHAIAADGLGFLEGTCRAGLEPSSPEAKFTRGTSIERRRFLFAAASSLLAGMIGVSMSWPALAGGGGGADLLSTDDACTNGPGGACHDTEQGGCTDSTCTNSALFGCNDDSQGTCTDTACNNEVCRDRQQCVDETQCTNGAGGTGYGACRDEGDCTDRSSCTNGRDCTDLGSGPTGCVDDACQNSNTASCNDSNCLDQDCVNSRQCADDPMCEDDGCQNAPDCTDLDRCVDFHCVNEISCNDTPGSNCSDQLCVNTGQCFNGGDCTDDGCQNSSC